jgi:hypothetical protein
MQRESYETVRERVGFAIESDENWLDSEASDIDGDNEGHQVVVSAYFGHAVLKDLLAGWNLQEAAERAKRRGGPHKEVENAIDVLKRVIELGGKMADAIERELDERMNGFNADTGRWAA